jgi:hypothetical protein
MGGEDNVIGPGAGGSSIVKSGRGKSGCVDLGVNRKICGHVSALSVCFFS